MGNEPNLIGSVVGSDTTATTYSVACVTEDCSFPTSFLVTEGPSSVEWTFTYALYNTDIPVTQKLNCQITDSSSGACTVTANYNPSSSPFSTTLITSFASPSDADIFLINTIVTSTAASTTRSGSGAMVSSPLSATGSSTKSAASVTGSSSSSGSSSSTSVSSAKGAPMITRAPLLLGAAAAIVYAAL